MSGGGWTIRIVHIVDAIERAQAFCHGLSYPEFRSDMRTAYAVVTCLAIIGEAASKVPLDVRTNHSHIPWDAMYRMRNVLVHDYDEIDLEIVWNTVHQDLPAVLEQLRTLRGDLP